MNGRIALTGGIATGKSFVAAMFAEMGAFVIDADKVAREVVRPGGPCFQALWDFLGPEFFDPDGRLRRRELRERIIRDSGCRSRLDAITHPAILAEMDRQWEEMRRACPGRPILFDIPLLFEANFTPCFDIIILVYAPPEIQVRRLAARDHVSLAEAGETLRMQFPIDAKRERSHIVIENGGGPEETRRQVGEVWERLFGRHGTN